MQNQTQSGASKDVIVNQAMREITGIRVNMYDLTANAQRTLFFYRWFFKFPPVVVLRVPERQQGQEYADVTAAVRFLADELQLAPIIDGSPNSIPPEALSTRRESIIVVEPLKQEQLNEIEDLEVFLAFLKEHRLDDLVWKVLGGVPAHYLTMQRHLRFPVVLTSQGAPEIIGSVVKYMLSTLSDALNKQVAKGSPMTKSIVKVFREHGVSRMTVMELEELKLEIEYPNKVFREMKTSIDWFVVPASNAVGLIITENIHSGKEIEALVEKMMARHK